MKRVHKRLIFIGVFFVAIILIVLLLVVMKQKKVGDELELPKMNISLHNTSIEEVELDEDVRFPGNKVTITSRDGERNYYDVEIKGHGNSTWEGDKKPYKLKFEHKADLFNIANVKEWVLIANLFDNTQLRNDIALYISEMLDMRYSNKGEYLELTIDDGYRGLYYLVPKIGISKGNVDLRSSMGVLVELDNINSLGKQCYYSNEGMCLVVDDVVTKDNLESAMQDFMRNFDRFEEASKEKDYEEISKTIDVDSFARYYLLSEFTVNPDAYTSSWYMYKDGYEDKIHAGPGWDFDFAFGNRNWVWNNDESFYSPDLDMVREADALGGKFIFNGETVEREPNWTISRVVFRLMKIPKFKQKVKEIFDETLAGRKMELLNYIGRKAEEIYPALLRNNERWREVDYWSEVNNLLDWVEKRYEHFEKTYGDGQETRVEYF